MKILFSTLALVGALVLGAQSASADSPAYCDGYALHYADQHTAGGAVGGAVLGGVGGAILGSIIGGRHGVAAGAVVGGVGGAAVGGSQWKGFYNDAYYRCINSGPPVTPAYVTAPPPPDPREWKRACAAKYGTAFDWRSGAYFASDGNYYPCQLP